MKSNQPHDPWSRLAAAAREFPDGRPTTAPYGFSTRVAALAAVGERVKVSLLERFALRAVSLACLLALGSILLNFSALTTEAGAEATYESDDLVAVLLAE